jgi:hypothetical protein
MPRTMSIVDNRKGKDELTHQCSYELELVSGIYRVKTLTVEKVELGPDYGDLTDKYLEDAKKSQQSLITNAVGTIEFEWLQFNEHSLKFPSFEELGTDSTSWREFLKLESR